MPDFAILNNETVINIVEADALQIVQAFYPDAEILESGSVHGVAFIGGDLHNGLFRPPQPYPSWTYDEVGNAWQAPVPLPPGTDADNCAWDEGAQEWIIYPKAD